jgi:hypothetical protein
MFPYQRSVRPADRATEFKQRCAGLHIKGVTLHSYRYSWAERAKKGGLSRTLRPAGPWTQQQGRSSRLREKCARGIAVPE